MYKFLQGTIGKVALFLFFLALGTLFLVLALNNSSSKYSVQVQATISDIESEWDSIDDNNDYTVYVDFEYDGKKYEHIKLDQYAITYSVGKELTVNINPDRINEAKVNAKFNTMWIFVIICYGFCLIDIYGMTAGKAKAKKIAEQNRINNEKIDQQNLFN